MDVDNVFGLFGFGKDKNKSKKIENDVEEFRNTPQFKVGMFYKMISNGIQFRGQLIKFFEKSTREELDLGIGEVGDYMMYTRAYYWIQECDIKKDEWKEALQHYLKQEGFENKECEKNSFINCFILSIKYFEEIEEFEKCAIMKLRIQDLTDILNIKDDINLTNLDDDEE